MLISDHRDDGCWSSNKKGHYSSDRSQSLPQRLPSTSWICSFMWPHLVHPTMSGLPHELKGGEGRVELNRWAGALKPWPCLKHAQESVWFSYLVKERNQCWTQQKTATTWQCHHSACFDIFTLLKSVRFSCSNEILRWRQEVMKSRPRLRKRKGKPYPIWAHVPVKARKGVPPGNWQKAPDAVTPVVACKGAVSRWATILHESFRRSP